MTTHRPKAASIASSTIPDSSVVAIFCNLAIGLILESAKDRRFVAAGLHPLL